MMTVQTCFLAASAMLAFSINARESFVAKEGTFKQIVERVSIREERSGAIVTVRGNPKSKI